MTIHFPSALVKITKEGERVLSSFLEEGEKLFDGRTYEHVKENGLEPKHLAGTTETDTMTTDDTKVGTVAGKATVPTITDSTASDESESDASKSDDSTSVGNTTVSPFGESSSASGVPVTDSTTSTDSTPSTDEAPASTDETTTTTEAPVTDSTAPAGSDDEPVAANTETTVPAPEEPVNPSDTLPEGTDTTAGANEPIDNSTQTASTSNTETYTDTDAQTPAE